jgi:outer membrane autotransporter protein
VGAGSTSNKSTRELKIDDTTYRMNGAWDGTYVNAGAEAGINAELYHVTVRPWVGLSYLDLNEESHAETGEGTGFDLAYDAIEADIERAKAGLVIAYTYDHPEVQFRPELHASWSELLKDVPDQLHGSFVDGAVPFVLSEAPIPHNEISAGAGFTLYGKGLAFSLGYDASFADSQLIHGGTLEISTQF